MGTLERLSLSHHCLTHNHLVETSLCLGLAVGAPQSRNFGRNFGSSGRKVGSGSGSGSNSPNTRFFTGNKPLDSAITGAALGLATQYIGNQIFNPCRGGGRRGQGTRQGNNPNTRFFGGDFGNGLLGFVGGYVGGQLFNNVQGNPCGR